MSITKLFLAEKLIEDYVKTPPTLKEQALTRLAIELCKDSEVKKHIMCTSDTLGANAQHRFDNDIVWKDLIENRTTAICEILPLPSALKPRLMNRIWWISVELLGWNKSHQASLRTPPELTYQFLIQSDWTVEGRLNQKKIADRLAQDTRVEICARYQLACLYCLQPHIHKLWNRLSSEDQEYMCGEGNPALHMKLSELVKLWSNHLAENVDAPLKLGSMFWQRALKSAVTEGATSAVVTCWEALNESKKRDILQKATLTALSKNIENNDPSNWMCNLIGNRDEQYIRPTYRCDVFYFLYSQMSEEQKISFFLRKIKEWDTNDYPTLSDSFETLLQWPYQDFFKPLVTKLWGILSGQRYGDVLLMVVNCGFIIWDNKDYDYYSLFMELLEEAPEKYKRYIFEDQETLIFNQLLEQLCKITPCLHRDIRILKYILQQATAEKKQIFIRSTFGQDLCYYVMEHEYWDIIDCLLSECMSVVDVAKFKDRYVKSSSGKSTYFDLISENYDEPLNAFLNFVFSSAEEISQFHFNSIFELQNRFFKYACELKLDFLNNIIRRCLTCELYEKKFKEQYIKTLGTDVCLHFIEQSKWDELEQFIKWCVPSDEESEKFKQELFVSKSREICGHLMLERKWETAELFFKWYNLSPEAIIQIKKESLLSLDIFSKIYGMMSEADKLEFVALCLRWALVDEDSVRACNTFFNKFKFKGIYCKYNEFQQLIIQVKWEKLMKDLFRELSEKVKDKNREQEDEPREDCHPCKISRRSL